MMLWKNGNKRIGLCVVVVTCCLLLGAIWVVLATPETVLAAKPEPGENPGGNVVKQDIPGVVTLGTGSITDDGATPSEYSDSEAGTTCFIGRRRGIWVSLSKNSPRSMNLTLGTLVADSFSIGDVEISQGDDPWGDQIMSPEAVNNLTEPEGAIYQVDLGIAPFQNVSGLPKDSTLDASTKLHFLDVEGNQWGLYFGRGRPLGVEDGWGGARFFTELTAAPVIVSCLTLNQSWTVDSSTPGYLWYRGSRKNAPWIYVGKYINVSWSCDVDYIP
ncbi:MAG: hypothetical protein ACYS6K_19985 [Planctomycetota bacterium]